MTKSVHHFLFVVHHLLLTSFLVSKKVTFFLNSQNCSVNISTEYLDDVVCTGMYFIIFFFVILFCLITIPF